MRFMTSGGDLLLLLLLNENRWINDSVLLSDDVTIGVAVEFEFTLLAGVFVAICSAAVVLLVSFAFIVAELLLLLFELFACVKLPLITFRGNGFGLIISTKKKQIIFQKRTKPK